jgi:hypothetical protein
MDARYEGPTLSRFLNEDPNFIQGGGPENWQNAESVEPQYAALNGFMKTSNSVYLANPQNLDPYSYVDNDPLTYKDPTGKCIEDYCITEGLVALLGAGFEGIPEYVNQYNRTGNVFLDQTGRNLVLGKAISGGAAALTALYNPAVAASLLTAGTLGTEQAFTPTTDPSELGSRTGTAIGGGLTLNTADSLADDILNPDLKKLLPDLYARVKLELGGGIGLGTKYAQSFLGGGNISQPMSTQGRGLYPNPVGGGSSYLPNTITENGITYVRNASGLLNFATPGKTR